MVLSEGCVYAHSPRRVILYIYTRQGSRRRRLVTWFRVLRNGYTKPLGYEVTRLSGYKVTRLQGHVSTSGTTTVRVVLHTTLLSERSGTTWYDVRACHVTGNHVTCVCAYR